MRRSKTNHKIDRKPWTLAMQSSLTLPPVCFQSSCWLCSSSRLLGIFIHVRPGFSWFPEDQREKRLVQSRGTSG